MNIRYSAIAVALAGIVAQADVSYSPITAGATESAQKVYNFLATNYQSKTISGIQTGDINTSAELKEQEDLEAVYNVSGKYPALIGFDFLFANGVSATNSWNKEYTSKTVELAIDLWNQGGIPAFSWHWKDPSHTVDAFYTKGSGDPFTDFDFTKAFKAGTLEWDTQSETYKQLTRDIDEIAVHFKKMQDAGAAAIFRPLHECGGTWFWWSTQSGEQYATLYRLVYTQMTEVKGIKNLVWVWNPQESIFTKSAWNPGASYYDVIGVDIYNNAYDYKSNVTAYKNMETNYGTSKILALSENGPIPDASLMHQDGAVWSWYMPWYESWKAKFVQQTKNTVWAANLGDPCVYTLDKMPGWGAYEISTQKVAACKVSYALGDLDTAVVVQDIVLDTKNGNGWAKVVIDNMHNQIDAKGDTTVPAAANLFITPTTNLTGALTASLTVYNTSTAGVWLSMAILTDGDWEWEMPPDGCWLNAGDSTVCTFDVSKMHMNKAAKVYIMVATNGYSGTIYFDNFITDKGVIASFDNAADLLKREQAGAEAYVKTIALVGGAGDGTQAVLQLPKLGKKAQISVQGKSISLTLNHAASMNLAVYNMQGHRVSHLHNGLLNQGVHLFDARSLTNGLYVVRASGASGTFSKQIIIK